GGEGLCSVEGERGDIGPRADASSVERRRQRMSGVVDEHDAARARELAQAVPVAGLPADVDADDRLRPFRDRAFDGGRLALAVADVRTRERDLAHCCDRATAST